MVAENLSFEHCTLLITGDSWVSAVSAAGVCLLSELAREDGDETAARDYTQQHGHSDVLPRDILKEFAALDGDNSGALDLAEVGRMMGQLGLPVDDGELTRVMRMFDADGDGTIDEDEFGALHAYVHASAHCPSDVDARALAATTVQPRDRVTSVDNVQRVEKREEMRAQRIEGQVREEARTRREEAKRVERDSRVHYCDIQKHRIIQIKLSCWFYFVVVVCFMFLNIYPSQGHALASAAVTAAAEEEGTHASRGDSSDEEGEEDGTSCSNTCTTHDVSVSCVVHESLHRSRVSKLDAFLTQCHAIELNTQVRNS